MFVSSILASAFSAPSGYLKEVSQPAATAICDNVTQYSGYYTLTTGSDDKHYFYWYDPTPIDCC